MNIKQKQLSAILKRVVGLTNKRTTLPVLSTIHLEATGGRCVVRATDLDCYATASCECEGELQAVCIRGSQLFALVQQATGEISLSLAANNKLSLKANGVAMLAASPAVDMPEFPKGAKSIGLSTEDLHECLSQVVWAADPNNNDRPLIRGVWCKTSPKSITCAATSGKEIGYVNRPTICATSEFVIPATSAPMLIEALQVEGSDYAINDKFVIASSPEYSVAVKQLEGRYWDVTQAFSKDLTLLGTVELKPLIDAIETIRMLADQMFDTVDLKFSPSGLIVEYASQVNDFKTTIEGQFETQHLLVGANLIYGVLKSCAGPTVKVTKALNTLVFECGEYQAVSSTKYKSNEEVKK